MKYAIIQFNHALSYYVVIVRNGNGTATKYIGNNLDNIYDELSNIVANKIFEVYN